MHNHGSMYLIRRLWLAGMAALVALALLLLAPAPSHGQQLAGPIYTVRAEGTLTSVTTDYLRRALQQAQSTSASALVISLQSGDGVLTAIRPFAAELAQASIPVVVFVEPAGTQSGAPGAFLLSAAHVAALAPDTSFGSIYPLERTDAALSTQSRALVREGIADQLQAWNSAQGRNTGWITRAMTDGVVLSNAQAVALQPPAVDIVATDQAQLLTLLEGRTVTLQGGRQVQITALGQPVVPIAPTLWESLRLILAQPTVAFALLVLGAIAVYLEFAAPGTTIFFGVGAILLAAAALGLVVLPLQTLPLVIVLVGLALVGGEFFVAAHGALALSGLVLLVIGALNLIDPAQAPGTSVAGWALWMLSLGLGGFAVFGALIVMRSRRQPVTVSGQEGLIGQLAEVRRALDPEGMVFVDGALWQAICEDGTAAVGDVVQVRAIHQLRLIVRHLEDDTSASVSAGRA